MKTVLATALGLVMAASLGYSQDPPGEPGEEKGDAPKAGSQAGLKEELDKAAAKAGAMTNYSCMISIKSEGMAGEGQDDQPIELLIQPGAPWQLKSGTVEAYKKGETVAVKEGAGWKKVDRSAKAGNALCAVRCPHEILRDLKSTSFKELKRDDSEGGRCFSGELTETAIKQLARGDRPLTKPTGTARVWVNGEGNVTKYEVQVEAKMKDADNKEVTVKRTFNVEIRDVGTTKYDVPPEAAKALEG